MADEESEEEEVTISGAEGNRIVKDSLSANAKKGDSDEEEGDDS